MHFFWNQCKFDNFSLHRELFSKYHSICYFYDRVQSQESVYSKFESECSKVFQFDFQFSNSLFTAVVGRRNQWVFKKVEYTVSALNPKSVIRIYFCTGIWQCLLKISNLVLTLSCIYKNQPHLRFFDITLFATS